MSRELPKTTGETVRLKLADGQVIAAYFNEDRRAWCWLNGHAGVCWMPEADERRIVAWAPLSGGFLNVSTLMDECDRLEPEPKAAWFVWTKHGRAPRFAHPSEEVATAEAERLARKNPGHSYLVMHVTHKLRVEPVAAETEAA